ncbi:MAG: hypothetical protein ABSG63_15475, partial [Spirochaetia bacterium]
EKEQGEAESCDAQVVRKIGALDVIPRWSLGSVTSTVPRTLADRSTVTFHELLCKYRAIIFSAENAGIHSTKQRKRSYFHVPRLSMTARVFPRWNGDGTLERFRSPSFRNSVPFLCMEALE